MTAKDDTRAAAAPSLSTEENLRLAEIGWGFMKSQALFAWGALGIADVLRDGPKTSAEIALAIGAHEPSLQRLLRALSTIDIVAQDEAGRFRALRLGAVFASDHPETRRNWAQFFGGRLSWRAWGELAQAVKSGKPGFDLVFGAPFFTYFAEHPDEGKVFHEGASVISRANLPRILAAYDFSPFKTIVDVGGGHGEFLRGVLEQHVTARGVLCDLAGTVAEARQLRESPAGARCEFVGTDMFESVPAGGDAYVMKQVLHDFNDDEVVRVLSNIRRGIAAAGKLIVIEVVVDPTDNSSWSSWSDLQMMVLLTGRERTKEEFAELYRRAGFRLERANRVVLDTPLSVLEGVPA